MKQVFVLSLVLLVFSCNQCYGQGPDFERTRAFIVEKVRCCAASFTPSSPTKVDSIAIARNGNVTLYYEPEKRPQTFNLFELYKASDTTSGILLSDNSKFIQFSVSDDRTRLISFATHAEAREVYQAFLDLLHLCEQDKQAFSDLTFHQVVEVINIRLAKWSSGPQTSITAYPNGDLIIDNGLKQFWRFNMLDLKDPNYKEGRVRFGIEGVTCDYRAKAPASWIHFYKGNQHMAFIKLKCTPDAEVEILQQAFLRLRSLCKR